MTFPRIIIKQTITLFDNVFERASLYYKIEGAAMQENLLNKKDSTVKNAEKYVGRYLQDLQTHFSLSDMQLIKILKNNLSNLKKRAKQKKWWQFF